MNITNLTTSEEPLIQPNPPVSWIGRPDAKKPVIILSPKARATKAQMAARRAALVAASRQTRIGSLIEACINVLIGFSINFFANLLILPLIGFHINIGQNLFIGVLYTFISVGRSYCIRRWFNGRIHAAALNLAEGAA